MSQFKIEVIQPESTLESRAIKLPVLPSCKFNIDKMSLLTYDLESLLAAVADFLKGNDTENRSILRKALKVLSSSLGDRKLAGSFQQLLKDNLMNNQVYQLMVIWAQICSLGTILLRITPERRKDLLHLIFSSFLFQSCKGEGSIQQQLPLLLSLANPKNILTHLQETYQPNSRYPLFKLIRKCRLCCKQNNQLARMIKEFLGHALKKGESQLPQMISHMEQHQEELNFLVQEIPNASLILSKIFKSFFNPDNVLQHEEGVSALAILRSSAIKEWLEIDHNFWKTVNNHFNSGSALAHKVLHWGKSLSKENLFSQSISIKYLYRYFDGQAFKFDREDKLVLSSGSHEPWTQIYKSIGQCHSLGFYNVIVMNVSHGIKHWPMQNPFSLKIRHKGLAQMVSKCKQKFEQTEKEYNRKNKKVQIVFSAVSLVLKENRSEMVVSFEQLRQHLEQNFPLHEVRKQYKPYQQEVKILQETRKDHNIIIDAKLVKLLKRSKESLTPEQIQQASGYQQSVVDLSLKRLCNKGMADLNEEGNKYIYLV